MTGAPSSKAVLVTGGTGGLGRAMARVLHAAGHRVIVCGRTAADLESITVELPGVRAIHADVSLDADRRALMVAATADGLDVLVNNAAITRAHDYTSSFTLAEDRIRPELETNFVAPVELTRLFLAWRRERGVDGRPATIAMVNTPGALFPLEANPLYCATKAALRIFTAALRRQLAVTPVDVVDIYPPALDTGLARDLEVAGQAANGADVVAEVAELCVAGILAGDRIVLPHPSATMLVERFAVDLDDAMLDQINAGVRRRPGWDAT